MQLRRRPRPFEVHNHAVVSRRDALEQLKALADDASVTGDAKSPVVI
ncbi:hypothetical protein V1294_005976 [Bradyrhizobium sp. AZCC 1678]